VLCDPQVLKTLDERDFRCGMAESIKHALIADEELLDWIEANRESIMEKDESVLTQLIQRSAMVKVGIVTEDERESGRRAVLNLGHTFAHAIEPIAELDLRHGEAVAIGLCAAGFVSHERSMVSDDERARIESIINAFGLPTRLAQPIDVSRLMSAMQFDKKVADGRLRFILPRGIGAVDIVSDVATEVIEAAWRHLGAR
jgi:3-dehydroquinate synthetase